MGITLDGDGSITSSSGSLSLGDDNLTTTGTIPASQLTGALPAISGAALTSLTSANLTGALPAVSGAALTALPATLPVSSAANLTNIPAGNLTGSVADARLPSALQSFPTPGSNGNVLTSNGSAWTSAAAGGGGLWELINFTEITSNSGTASINYTSLTSHHVFKLICMQSANPFSGPGLKLGVGTGSHETTSNYRCSEDAGKASLTASNFSALVDERYASVGTAFRLGFGGSFGSNVTYIFNLRAAIQTQIIVQAAIVSGNNYIYNIAGFKSDTTQYSSLHLLPTSSAHCIGRYWLLGLKES